MRECVLNPDQKCRDCGDCERCDLDRDKICNNCCQCLGDADYRGIEVEKIIAPKK